MTVEKETEKICQEVGDGEIVVRTKTLERWRNAILAGSKAKDGRIRELEADVKKECEAKEILNKELILSQRECNESLTAGEVRGMIETVKSTSSPGKGSSWRRDGETNYPRPLRRGSASPGRSSKRTGHR